MNSINNDNQNLKALKEQALDLMKSSGFAITQEVEVQIDAKLPFMGYTTDLHGKPLIVVSENAMKGGMAINLLVHELSHVYRTQSGHPSHNYTLLSAIAGWVMQGSIAFSYQEKILHTIINHLQDLYADDISFVIFTKNTPQQDLNQFFLSWIHEPSTASDPAQKAWENADHLLSTAFAAANLERHNIQDKDGNVARAVEAFLSKTGKHYKDKFYFFKEFMVRLPEKVTDKEYEKLLIAYLSEFLKLTKTV
ncbi:MAG: hypothetical protein H0W89_05955 [Candidatus Levybacteria bacterium]|nr:hypothetical protein [Candidatus Levybacteria bacterium]